MSIKKAQPVSTKTKKWNQQSEPDAIQPGEGIEMGKYTNNMVVIGNNQIELKPIGKLAGLLGFTKKYAHLLTEKEKEEKDAELEKAEYVIINGVIWVLMAGSKVHLRQYDAATSYAEEGDMSIGGLSIVALYSSTVDSGSDGTPSYVTDATKTTSFLFQAQLFCEVLGLRNMTLIHTTIRGKGTKLNNGVMKHSSITAGYIDVNAVKIQSHHISTDHEVRIKNYRTGISNIHSVTRATPFQARNITIAPNHALVSAEFKIPCLNSPGNPALSREEFDINIVNRIDYGVFNGVRPVNFVRVNRCDFLLDGLFITADKLELTYARFKNDIGDNPHQYTSCKQTEEEYLAFIRELRNKAIGDGQSARYLPDSTNRIENGLILGFIEQLRSRSNLYKQLSFLADGQ